MEQNKWKGAAYCRKKIEIHREREDFRSNLSQNNSFHHLFVDSQAETEHMKYTGKSREALCGRCYWTHSTAAFQIQSSFFSSFRKETFGFADLQPVFKECRILQYFFGSSAHPGGMSGLFKWLSLLHSASGHWCIFAFVSKHHAVS